MMYQSVTRKTFYVLTSIFFILLSSFGKVTAEDVVGGSVGEPGLILTTSFEEFYRKEPVVITLTNNSLETVELPSPSPWRVVDGTGSKVFNPFDTPVILPLKPGESKSWVWDQRNFKSIFVESGTYIILFDSLSLAAPIEINKKLGSQGFFTFDVTGETLRVYAQNPLVIRDAIENYYGLNPRNMPIARLVDDRPGKSPFDPQWSWHMDPVSLHMTGLAVEVCDGWPGGVEEDLDYWMHLGFFCPNDAVMISLD